METPKPEIIYSFVCDVMRTRAGAKGMVVQEFRIRGKRGNIFHPTVYVAPSYTKSVDIHVILGDMDRLKDQDQTQMS